MLYYVEHHMQILHLIILVRSSSISLGMKLSITLKAGVKLPGCMAVGSRSLVIRAPAAKAGGPAWIRFPVATLVFFFFSSWLTNVDGMKDLWYSSIARLLSTQI